MVVICEACKTVLEMGLSSCCKTDASRVGGKNICNQCNNECEIIEDEIPEIDVEEDDTSTTEE